MYSERTTIQREVGAIQIPDGSPAVLSEGTSVMITQELGGSFTVMTERGAMFRIDEKNADALGREVAPEAEPATGTEGTLEERVWAQMRKCYDPEIPVNVVDLGLIYDCSIVKDDEAGQKVSIQMTLTAPGCGMGPVLAHDVKTRIEELDGVAEADIDVVFDPPWGPNMMTEAARLQLGFM
ncbi:MAG: putative Fe-S cluster assembly protein SufT [Acidobacteriota bacterium]|nr:putative Fe-S cluster assembly protein SufT [Acidobacteriota bacterium]